MPFLEGHQPPAQPTLKLLGIGMIAFGVLGAGVMLGSILQRRALAVEGVIVSSNTDCWQPHRCVSTYVLRTPANENVTHKAGYGESFLPEKLAVGTRITKKAGEFSYRIDDETIGAVELFWSLLFCGAPVVFIAVGIWLLRYRGPSWVRN